MATSTVFVQTMRGSTGIEAQFAVVAAAVKAHNAANKTNHVAELIPVLPNNVKGMQFVLALCATAARVNGASMIRLNVHGGAVALCGPAAAVKATNEALPKLIGQYRAACDTTYNQSVHGNKVGFTNGFLCGSPAGLQIANKVVPSLAYGVGFLFEFPVPGDGKAYAIGQAAAIAAVKPAAARQPKAKAAAVVSPTAAEAAAVETVETVSA